MKSSARGIGYRFVVIEARPFVMQTSGLSASLLFLTLMRFDAASERFDPYVQWLIQFFFTDAYAVPSSVVFSRI